METVDHILSKMREPSCFKGKIPVERVDADFREFADRLEAAIKRDYTGNVAKLREALGVARELILSQCNGGTSFSIACAVALVKIDSALAEPLRNCDAFSKAEVLEVLEDRSFSKEDTIEWLFAEAKGGSL